jgi:ABC-type transporter Mla MlaB component
MIATTPAPLPPIRASVVAPEVYLIELAGVITGATVGELRSMAAETPPGIRSCVIRCSKVRDLDPVGAALLWNFCTGAAREFGWRIRIVDLPPRLTSRLRAHPLLACVEREDDVFGDPFLIPGPSKR